MIFLSNPLTQMFFSKTYHPRELFPAFYRQLMGTFPSKEHGAKAPRVLGIADLERIRARSLWIVYCRQGKYRLVMPYRGLKVLVPCDICADQDGFHVMSYRWKGLDEADHCEGCAPLAFTSGDIVPDVRYWVDYMNHLDDPRLKIGVIQQMGLLYANKKVYAKYLHDYVHSPEGFLVLINCLTRGWVWQEIAITDDDVMPTQSDRVRLLIEMVKTGSEIVRGIVPNGYGHPNSKPSMHEIVKFGADALWRARNLGRNEAAIRLFVRDYERYEELLGQAADYVRNIRTKHGDVMMINLLAAFDNLENVNFTRKEDGFHASFSTFMAKYAAAFKGQDFTVWATTKLEQVTREQGWDLEVWQQCVAGHSLAQLNHTRVSKIFCRPDRSILVAVGEDQIVTGLSYSKVLYGDYKATATGALVGEFDVRSCNYRILHGEVVLVGVNTSEGVRVVFDKGVRLRDGAVSAETCSRWATTTWYSVDEDWSSVLDSWELALEDAPPPHAPDASPQVSAAPARP
jgi:hypothetical protein